MKDGHATPIAIKGVDLVEDDEMEREREISTAIRRARGSPAWSEC